MDDTCISMVKPEILFLIPILLSVKRSLQILEIGKISKRAFIIWYILCIVICNIYELINGFSTGNLFVLEFSAIVQGLLIGSLSLNLKNMKLKGKRKADSKDGIGDKRELD